VLLQASRCFGARNLDYKCCAGLISEDSNMHFPCSLALVLQLTTRIATFRLLSVTHLICTCNCLGLRLLCGSQHCS